MLCVQIAQITLVHIGNHQMLAMASLNICSSMYASCDYDKCCRHSLFCGHGLLHCSCAETCITCALSDEQVMHRDTTHVCVHSYSALYMPSLALLYGFTIQQAISEMIV